MSWYDYITYAVLYYEYNLFKLGGLIYHYPILALAPLGLIGNIIVFMVYVSKELRRQSISFYYAANIFFDTIFILTNFISQIAAYSPYPDTTFTCRAYLMAIYVTPIISALISMMATIDRLRFIVYPSRWKFMEKRWFQWTFLSSTIIIPTAIFVPSALNDYYGYLTCSVNSTFVSYVYGWVYFILSTVVPNLVMIPCTIRLIVAIVQSKKKFNQKLKGSKQSSKGTKMAKNILVINFLFLLTNTLTNLIIIIFNATSVYSPAFFWNNFGKMNVASGVSMLLDNLYRSCLIFVHYFTNRIFADIVKNAMKKAKSSICKN